MRTETEEEDMKRYLSKFKEWWSIKWAQKPQGMLLLTLVIMNVLLIVIASCVISLLSVTGTEHMNVIEAAFCTITMILDAGCIQYVVADVGTAGVILVVFCLFVIILGMLSFTGSLIGYITNLFSNKIETADSGRRPLKISDHIIILNWNSRASEIINDLLYKEGLSKVVVLVGTRRKEVELEISERISDTINRENAAICKRLKAESFLQYKHRVARSKMKNSVSYVVREGDVFSTKQLNDISIKKAKSIIILGSDSNNCFCTYEQKERKHEAEKGNPQTVKILMQVSDMTSSSDSNDNQRIIVEITDEWTQTVVNKVIECKLNTLEAAEKCNIIPVNVNLILGQLLSQFSLMPELNLAYGELFSNKGLTFNAIQFDNKLPKDFSEEEFIRKSLKENCRAIPLTAITSRGNDFFCYATNHDEDMTRNEPYSEPEFSVKLNYDYVIEPKNVVILGHNSISKEIMEGFDSFYGEWGRDGNKHVLRIAVIDDEDHLKKMNYYREYSYVSTIKADVFDQKTICNALNAFIDESVGDTSVLILSDDSVLPDKIDSNVLANLIYVQDIINQRVKKFGPAFDTESIDVVVEINDPKHYDVVNSYSTNNVVISNRYISKMITQIGSKDALLDFYNDILSFDDADAEEFTSKEVSIKKVKEFFEAGCIPGECTQGQLIRAVFEASSDDKLPPEKRNPSMVLGYVSPNGRINLFGYESRNKLIRLNDHDKLVIYSCH